MLSTHRFTPSATSLGMKTKNRPHSDCPTVTGRGGLLFLGRRNPLKGFDFGLDNSLYFKGVSYRQSTSGTVLPARSARCCGIIAFVFIALPPLVLSDYLVYNRQNVPRPA